MDALEFGERLAAITGRLNPLADDLYQGIEDKISGAERAALLARAKALLRDYDEFVRALTGERRQDFEKRCRREIGEIRGYAETLEKMT